MTLIEAIAIARQVLAAKAAAIHAAARRGVAAHIEASPFEAAQETLDDLRRVIEDDPRDYE